MKKALIALGLLVPVPTAHGADPVYEGTWVTTNRKLDGTLSCVVTDLGNQQWRGQFTGEWRGTPFTYTVRFSGPPEKLHGTAVIDGADYDWTASIRDGRFKATFDGNRYVGGFDMKQKGKAK
jgi:hypothetical protein